MISLTLLSISSGDMAALIDEIGRYINIPPLTRMT